jgi:hypothetical protein
MPPPTLPLRLLLLLQPWWFALLALHLLREGETTPTFELSRTLTSQMTTDDEDDDDNNNNKTKKHTRQAPRRISRTMTLS